MKKFFLGIKGIIVQSERLLLLERNSPHPFWEAPGGRLEEGEQPHDTLLRELQEELPGIKNISIKNLLGSSKENVELKDNIGLILFYYRVDAVLPAPLLLSNEHHSYCWINKIEQPPNIHSNELKRIIKDLGF